MTTAISSVSNQQVACTTCSNHIEDAAKFCGDCGSITEYGSGAYQAVKIADKSSTNTAPASAQSFNQVSYDELAKLDSYRLAQAAGNQTDWAPTPTPLNNDGQEVQHDSEDMFAPGFALKGKEKPANTGISESLVREMQSLNAILLRERIFLVMHYSIFLASNLLGLYLASQCYVNFHGDEVTRFVLALTPLTFINAVALACLAPIKGTKREISRVQERLQYLKVQIEYGNLI